MDLRLPVSKLRKLQSHLGQVVQGQETLFQANRLIKLDIIYDARIDFSRLVKITDGQRNDTGRALLFRRGAKADPLFFAYLVFPNGVNALNSISIESSAKETLPLLIGLIQYHETRRRVVTVPYLFDSALTTNDAVQLTYFNREPVDQSVSQLTSEILGQPTDEVAWMASATLLHWLKNPVTELPYKPGHKERLIGIFNRAGVRLIGDLAQKTEEDLKEFASPSDILLIKNLLQGIGLQLGFQLPGWKNRIQNISV